MADGGQSKPPIAVPAPLRRPENGESAPSGDPELEGSAPAAGPERGGSAPAAGPEPGGSAGRPGTSDGGGRGRLTAATQTRPLSRGHPDALITTANSGAGGTVRSPHALPG